MDDIEVTQLEVDSARLLIMLCAELKEDIPDNVWRLAGASKGNQKNVRIRD